MIFEELHLDQVPFLFGVEDVVGPEFREEGGPDAVEVIPAEVVEVGITNDLFQLILRALRDLGGHDHTADLFDLGGAVAELRQGLSGNEAALFLVLYVADHKSGVVKKGCCFEQYGVVCRYVFQKTKFLGNRQNIQRMVQTMVGQLGRELPFKLFENKIFGSFVIHISPFDHFTAVGWNLPTV